MHSEGYTCVPGGLTAVAQIEASGVACGIKASGLDLGIVHSRVPARCAAVFTQNQIKGAHVPHCMAKAATGAARTIVVNSGNANACNGAVGPEHVQRMADSAARALDIDAREVYPNSTGTIGIVLPIDKVCAGITEACAALSATGGNDFARAIMTTDTVPKEYAVSVPLGDASVTIGGVSKGAGMIEPNMATMLAYIATDADISSDALQPLLLNAVAASFNAISVDGDQSCNDTVLLLANGASGVSVTPGTAQWDVFSSALQHVCDTLAKMIVMDGEGATKLVTVQVVGALDDADARRASRAVANSLLVKTSWFGEDPNWGRVIDAVGYSGATLDADRIVIQYDDVTAYRGDTGPQHENLNALEGVLRQEAFKVHIDLAAGHAECALLTCDISEEYVRINSEYTT